MTMVHDVGKSVCLGLPLLILHGSFTAKKRFRRSSWIGDEVGGWSVDGVVIVLVAHRMLLRYMFHFIVMVLVVVGVGHLARWVTLLLMTMTLMLLMRERRGRITKLTGNLKEKENENDDDDGSR